MNVCLHCDGFVQMTVCIYNAGSTKTVESLGGVVIGVFKSQCDVLANMLQHELSSIASKIYSKSINSAAALEEAMNQVNIASARAVSLLSVVEDKIRAEPHVFFKFLGSEPALKPLAKKLLEEYLNGT